MTSAEILRAARDLIANPLCWTQGAFARDSAGNSIMWEAPDAVCWCAVGAVMRVTDESYKTGPGASAYLAAYRALTNAALPKHSVEAFNDNSPHIQVLDLFDRAINRLEPATTGP